MKFKECEYKVCYGAKAVEVRGFAVECGSPERFAVRLRPEGWRADHWETGFVFGEPAESKEVAAILALARLTADPKRTAKAVAAARARIAAAGVL
jgi:hypothetical protein